MKSTLLNLSAIVLFCGTSNAALITGTSIVSATTGSNANMSPSDAIDGGGLSGGAALTGTHSTTWTDHWWGAGTTPQITIDLGGNYNLDTIHIWNYNENGQSSRGLQNVEIYVSTDASDLNLVKLITSGPGSQDNGSGNFLFAQAPSLSTYSGFGLDMAGVTNASLLSNARLVRIQALDTHGSTGGLAEVQFGGTSAVPEPSSIALLGLGGLALILRRRK